VGAASASSKMSRAASKSRRAREVAHAPVQCSPARQEAGLLLDQRLGAVRQVDGEVELPQRLVETPQLQADVAPLERETCPDEILVGLDGVELAQRSLEVAAILGDQARPHRDLGAGEVARAVVVDHPLQLGARVLVHETGRFVEIAAPARDAGAHQRDLGAQERNTRPGAGLQQAFGLLVAPLEHLALGALERGPGADVRVRGSGECVEGAEGVGVVVAPQLDVVRRHLPGDGVERRAPGQLLGGGLPDPTHQRLLDAVALQPGGDRVPVAGLEGVVEEARRALTGRVGQGVGAVDLGVLAVQCPVALRVRVLETLTQRPCELTGETTVAGLVAGHLVQEGELEGVEVLGRAVVTQPHQGVGSERRELGDGQRGQRRQELAQSGITGDVDELAELLDRELVPLERGLADGLTHLGQQRERTQLLERAPCALDDVLLLRGGAMGEAGPHETSRLRGRGRRELDRALERAEALHGAGRHVGHAGERSNAGQPAERLEQRQPQPLGRAHARHLGGVEPQGRHAQAVLAGHRLRHVQEEHGAPGLLASGIDDHPRDLGLRVRLHGERARGTDAQQLGLDELARHAQRQGQPAQGAGQVARRELQADDAVGGARLDLQGLLDVVGQQGLARARAAGDQQMRGLAAAHPPDEGAIGAPLLTAQELQHLLFGRAAGRQQHLQLRRPQRRLAGRRPELSQDLEEDALVGQLALVAVDDVADDVGVGAPALHLLAEPVDAS